MRLSWVKQRSIVYFCDSFLFLLLAGSVRRRFKDTTVSDVMELVGNWLKDAPAREKKRVSRIQRRERAIRDLESVEFDGESDSTN